MHGQNHIKFTVRLYSQYGIPHLLQWLLQCKTV